MSSMRWAPTDDELLSGLAVALAPEPTEPPAASVKVLRRAAAGLTVSPPSPRRSRLRLGRTAALPAAIAATLMASATAVAAATGASLPPPLRAAAYRVGLPVDSPALVAARATEEQLRRDLPAANPQTVASDVAALRSRLSRVDEGELRQLEPEADALLRQATQILEAGTDRGPRNGEGDRAPTRRTSAGGSATTEGRSSGPSASGRSQEGGGTQAGAPGSGAVPSQPSGGHDGGQTDGGGATSGGDHGSTGGTVSSPSPSGNVSSPSSGGNVSSGGDLSSGDHGGSGG